MIERDWERIQGANTLQRTANIGKSAIAYRKVRGLADGNRKDKAKHVNYIHRFGQDLLETQERLAIIVDDHTTLESIHSSISSKESSIEESFPQLVELTNASSNTAIGVSLHTSKWTSFMIQSACEYIISLFSYSHLPHSTHHININSKHNNALLLLTHLCNNHMEAIQYMKTNIGNIIHKSTNNHLYKGHCSSLLRLYPILLMMKLKFRFTLEFTEYSFTQLYCNMCLLEYSLAACLIQHAYRRKHYKIYQKSYENSKTNIILINKYMNGLESKSLFNEQYYRKYYIYTTQWKAMHISTTTLFPTLKTPSQIPVEYIEQGLDILISLVSDKEIQLAQQNRLDVLSSNILLLLSTFLIHTNINIANKSSILLRFLSFSVESIPQLLNLGVFDTCLSILVKQSKSVNSNNLYDTCINALDVITNIAKHISGYHRANLHYDYIQKKTLLCPEINYAKYLKEFSIYVTPLDIQRTLTNDNLFTSLMDILITSSNVLLLKSVLFCLLGLSCGPCYSYVIEHIGRLSGKIIFRLVELLEESHTGIAHITLALFLQICKYSAGRSCLLSCCIMDVLTLLLTTLPKYSDITYLYAIYIMIAICQSNDLLPLKLNDTCLFTHESIKEAIMETIMLNIMACDVNINSKFIVKDLVLKEKCADNCIGISTTAFRIGVGYIADYFTNPSDCEYYRSLSPTEYCARAIVLSSLCSISSSAAEAATHSCVLYLCHCVYYSSYLFQGKPISHDKAKLVLITVLHASCALRAICSSQHISANTMSIVHNTIAEVNVIEAASFFMRTLSTFHIGLEEHLKEMQCRVAINCIQFLDAYAYSYQHFEEHDMTTLNNAAEAAILVLKHLKIVHRDKSFIYEIFHLICWFLAKYCYNSDCALNAIQTLQIFEALYIFIPTSGSSISEYNGNIIAVHNLHCSFFELLSNLCKIELGVVACLSKGFLKVTMDKLALIYDVYDDNSLNVADELSTELTACLAVVSRCANYNNRVVGSANDIILGGRINVLVFCIDILSICARNEVCYRVALHTLSVLSEDKTRSSLHVCTIKVIRLITIEIQRSSEHTTDSIFDFVKLAYNIGSGIRIAACREALLILREALFQIARVYPQFTTAVKDAIWAISQYSISVSTLPSSVDGEKLESYFTAKESFQLVELGINISDLILKPTTPKQEPKHEPIFPIMAIVNSDPELADLFVKVGDFNVSAANSPSKLASINTFISNDGRIPLLSSKKTSKSSSSKMRRSGKERARVVLGTVDVEALPELRFTRPPPQT